MRKLINRRLPMEDSMPPLTEVCSQFKGFKPGEKLVDRIF